MTNRERINKMSDEELADIMTIKCIDCPYDGECSGISCEDATLRWLELESEVEE